MIIVYKILLFVFFIISTSAFAFESEKQSINIALYGLDKNTASTKTVKKMLLKLFKKIEKLENFNVNTFFYKNEKELIRDFISNKKKFDILYTVPITFIKNHKTFYKYGNDFVTLKNHDKYKEYYLIKNKNLKIKSLKGMENKKLVTASSDELSRIWLDYIFLSETKKSYKFYIKQSAEHFKMYKRVLDVYFDKTDFAVVHKNIWDTTIELNPNITKKIEIFRKSKQIFPGIIGVFHRDVNKDLIRTYNEFIQNPKNKEYIHTLLNLVKLNSVEVIKKHDYQKSVEFYLKYKKMKEKLK